MKILSSSTFLMSLLATLMLGACDTTNDTVMDVSRDCIVSRVTVGTLNRTLQTVSSTGADSTYQVTVNGAMYPMFIDQLNNRIYNADSLPVGTDVTKVVFADFNVSGQPLSKVSIRERTPSLPQKTVQTSLNRAPSLFTRLTVA